MEYIHPFEAEFISRTLKIVEQYDRHVMTNVEQEDQFEVTLLINCLLGLLVLPKERLFHEIPQLPMNRIAEWHLQQSFVKAWSANVQLHRSNDPHTLQDLVHRLRNSVAHLSVMPNGNGADITSLSFRDLNGFHAEIPVISLKPFILKLAEHVRDVGQSGSN